MNTEKKILLDAFEKYKNRIKNAFESFDIETVKKSAEYSEQARNVGNRLFLKKNHDSEDHIKIFRYYCCSIAFAPIDTEIFAKACANRSAFLLHVHEFKECMKDVDRTLKITESEILKIKLLCYKVECMKKLGLSNCQSVLDEAENYAKNVNVNNKAQVEKLINKAKNCTLNNSTVSSELYDSLSEEQDNILDYVSIEHNDKYGRHLIAKKDYNPGDLIFSDKLYATLLTPTMNHTNCKYCLKKCWSGIPCDHCSWAIFCSEDCKNKGWQSFHDIECSVMPHLTNFMQKAIIKKSTMLPLALRIVLIGLREVGSITKLKEELKLVDECTDDCRKGLYRNNQFDRNTIQSAYSLGSRKIPKSDFEDLAFSALIFLICVVKKSKLIEDVKFDKIDDFVLNEDMIFLGSLLMKLTLINVNNGFSLIQKHSNCRQSKISNEDTVCCGSGPCLAIFASLMNHSCNPNACSAPGECGKINILALKPIKQNSQIFISYTGSYYTNGLEDRQKLFNLYNFKCECEACIQRWPVLFSSPFDMYTLSDFEKKLYYDCGTIFKDLEAKKIDFNQTDIEKLRSTIMEANKHLKEPNYLIAILTETLKDIYSCIYRWESLIYTTEKCPKV